MKIGAVFLLVLVIGCVHAQITSAAYIRQQAIPISDLKHPDDKIYEGLRSYRAILIGECHGSQEPAAFVEGLARLFASKGRRVTIGMEIPADAMQAYRDSGTRESLLHTRFFTKWGDGRSSEAWASLILAFHDSMVRYIFYDQMAAQYRLGTDRDSSMFQNINPALASDTGAVFIGISGNFHNQLDCIDSQLKAGYVHRSMAWYLWNESRSAVSDTTRILSLDHVFDTGSV